MKKIIAFILTLTMLMSMIIPAYAAESTVSHEIVTIGDREVEVTTIFSDTERTVLLNDNGTIHKAVYDIGENTIAYTKINDSEISAYSDDASPDYIIDLNHDEPSSDIQPYASYEFYYSSKIFYSYYAYAIINDGAYELLYHTSPMVRTPPLPPRDIARKCQDYYTGIIKLEQSYDNMCEVLADEAKSLFISTGITALKYMTGSAIASNALDIAIILADTMVNADGLDDWMSASVTAIATLKNMSGITTLISVYNVYTAFDTQYDNFWDLQHTYQYVYDYYN